ncbi:substrate-binding domain-containing protein [Cupriavidus pauculus]|uniref:ABC transporter substrate-binding protein n=1 Tax=Cupriavidus pauculus TaxID=82633 RepID=A0A2N5C6W8_9BURK|nr:substrate-binding domain-containing protein [Cupriavidus pauculus]PLP97975.1 ABC transporter substrate-binding protein [Cupriavidus pauculus]
MKRILTSLPNHPRIAARIAGTTITALALLLPTLGHAGDLLAVTSGGFAEASKQLTSFYNKENPSAPVTLTFGPSMGKTDNAIPARLARQEPIDVVIMVGGALDQLMDSGRLEPGSKVVLANSKIACAVPAGKPQPDLHTVASVRQAFLDAPSIAWSDSASGEYIQGELLARLGIETEVKKKGKQIPATPVGEILAKGEAAFGCQQHSELQPVHGIDIVAELPDELQRITPYAAAIVKGSPHRAAARAFIQYLAAPPNGKIIRATGLTPLSDK